LVSRVVLGEIERNSDEIRVVLVACVVSSHVLFGLTRCSGLKDCSGRMCCLVLRVVLVARVVWSHVFLVARVVWSHVFLVARVVWSHLFFFFSIHDGLLGHREHSHFRHPLMMHDA